MRLQYQCPDCGKMIVLNVTTIDKLQDEINDLRTENSRLRQRLNNSKNASKHADMDWFIDALNKGG